MSCVGVVCSHPIQGSESVPVAHSPEGALHVQLQPAEVSGSHGGHSELVPVCMDRWRPAEPGSQCPSPGHLHYIQWPGLQPV